MDKQSFIRTTARENGLDPLGSRILWSRHAIVGLIDAGLSRRHVEVALQACQVIEDYAVVHRPLPDCLVLCWLESGDPLHAVVALDVDRGRLLVITVYRPNREEWQNDWQTRKSG
jgi:hypothetical protein